MPVARNSGSTSLVDILDRVLDQGIRFEAWPQAARSSARPDTGTPRITVKSVETHLEPPVPSTGTGA